ncbi:phage regulatory protein/antirepressor Ant [Cysteiniphilum halobium]|uniref:phage regulatory protein/antirepressor Ant n=1 Tax=Cysteiniphilum halobium TaxID=2219059 RepID=UPI003F84E63B
MKDLIKAEKLTMSSREIAELMDKEHYNVLRDIEALLGDLKIEATEFQSTYKDVQGKSHKCYNLPKRETLILVSGYNVKMRAKIIDRWQELEAKENSFNIPKTLPDALRLAANLADENQLLQLENSKKDQLISEFKPKADYVDLILNSPSLVTITQIAKDYGLSGRAMNQRLHELGIQYKQSDQWLLYSKYHASGYTSSETIKIETPEGITKIKMQTKWTQKGRLFLYEKLKTIELYPIIEKQAA